MKTSGSFIRSQNTTTGPYRVPDEVHSFIRHSLKPTVTSTFHMHKYLRGPFPFRLQDKISDHSVLQVPSISSPFDNS